VAEKVAQTLAETAEIIDGCAYWAFGPDEPTKWVHWCNGSSGIGSALLRLYQVTGEKIYLSLCRQAANSVMRSRWRSPLVQCHGLAGNGEFLLDMFVALGDETFLQMAKSLGDIIYSRRVLLENQILFPDETGMRLSADYGIGYTGVAAFLLRLSTLSPRLMMLDNLT
jgi:lantibiotic modifying enzyme